MTRTILLALIATLAYSTQPLYAQRKEAERLDNAGKVLTDILNVPEDIPRALLDKAECVIVLPSVIKLAVGVGGSYGRGAMVCRSGDDFTGHGEPRL